jgi:hypothetical protein
MNVTVILLAPPLAFLIYLGLVGVLSMIGRGLAPASSTSAVKSSQIASGEAPPYTGGAPGYRPFFLIALFFAILHLGVLVIGSGGFNWVSAAYLIGLVVALAALVLG